MTDQTDALYAQLVTAARAGCRCASYRKPCEYHQGWADGAEAALAVTRPVTPDAVLCPVSPEMVAQLREGWTTRGRARIWLDDDNVLNVQELPDDEGDS